MRKTFKYRCYPNVGTRKRARRLMRDCGRIWNNALAERWRNFDAICVARQEDMEPPNWVTAYSQYHHVAKSNHPEFERHYVRALQPVLGVLDSSFKSYRALRKKEPDAKPPGQMRFCRWFTYHKKGWWLKDGNLYLAKLGPNGTRGRFPLVLHREIEGKIKTVTIREERSGKWYACFSCELADPAPKLPAPDGTVELDFQFCDGLFLRDSEGREIGHPEFYFSEISTLGRLNRALSRKQKRSESCPKANNRRKAQRRLAKWHEHIVNRRNAFLWPIARYYAEHYSRVTVPAWPLKEKIHYAVSHREAMRLCDASYGRFVSMLKHKCKEFGTELIEKENTQWELEKRKLTERAQLRAVKDLLRKARKNLRANRSAALPSLAAACERVRTLQI